MEPWTFAYAVGTFGAFVMAANQYLSKADRFTERFPFLKPQGWWNYLPLPCFILAGLIGFLASRPIAEIRHDTSGESIAAQDRFDPTTLPKSVSQAYVALMSADHTDLQKENFLASHAGKYLDLTLQLASLWRSGDQWSAQFRVGENSDVFVNFPKKWEDYLLDKNVGDVIHFRAKIVKHENGNYELQEAEML